MDILIIMKKKLLDRLWKNILLIVALIFVCFPIVWAVTASFKTRLDMFSIPPILLFKPTLTHYREIITSRAIFKHIANSTIIAVFSTLFSVSFGSMTAYSLARFKFFGSNFLAGSLLFGRMIPPIIFVVPYFIIMRKLGLIDTHLAVIITHICFNLTFVVWLMRSFFIGIPRELEESALIDGCSQMGAFLRITLPLAGPGLATTAIFCFLYSWNEFLYAFILTQSKARTLPVLAASFVTPVGVLWGQVFSITVVVMTPMLVLGILIRKHFVKGLTLGAVKG